MAPCPGTTPILDRIQPPPPAPPRRKRYLPYLIGGVIGAAAVPLTSGRPALESPLAILLFILFFQLAVGIHEAGHVIAGSLLGFSCRGVQVCCYRILKTTAGWRFTFMWKRIVSGGLAFVFPSSRNQPDWQYAAMVAAGPFASLLLWAFVAFVPWPEALDAARVPALVACGILGAVSLAPFNSGVLVSDMGRLITYFRGGDSWKRWKLVLGFATLNVQGVRPREWDPETLAEAAALPGGRASDRLQTLLIAYMAADDRRDFAQAAQYLDAALAISDKIGALGRSCVFLTAAGFQARRRKNAAASRAWLADAGKAPGMTKEVIAAIQASVLLAEGNFAEARTQAEFALSQMQRKTINAASTSQALDDLKELIEEAAAGTRASAAIAT